jgi:hypothetical protein
MTKAPRGQQGGNAMTTPPIRVRARNLHAVSRMREQLNLTWSRRATPRLLRLIAILVATLAITRTASAQVGPRVVRNVPATIIARIVVTLDATREYEFRTSNLACLVLTL